MLIKETLEGISHRVRDFRRGYTEAELSETERIARGQVTPIDLQRFRTERVFRASHLLYGSRIELTVAEQGLFIAGEVKRVRELPDDEILREAQSAARENLTRWGINP